MADNANLTAGDGTIIAGADEIAGVKYPRTKVVWGPDGTVNDTDVASGKPLPVQLRTATGTATPLPSLGTPGSSSVDVISIQGVALGTVVPVSVATLPSQAVTNTGTFATQSTQAGTWTVQPGNTVNTTAWKVDASSVAIPVTDNAGSLTVDGTVTSNMGTVTADPFGANADSASATGSISAKLKGIATALGVTALDLGVGTGGTRTLRVAIDSAQTEGSAYENVPVSTTDQVIGATGAAGDYLSHVIVSPITAACGVVTIKDNATTLISFAGGSTTALSNLIPFAIPVGITSTSGAWKITTGANVTCVAVGRFT